MKKILCYGDSNTWGYDPRKTTPEVMARYEDTVRWTGRLEMELGKDLTDFTEKTGKTMIKAGKVISRIGK